MKRQIQFVCLIGVVFWQAWCPGVSGAAPVLKAECLNCHGPFDKLATSTAGYAAPSGEKTTPHRYVPHEAKAAKAIPECSNCHQPHSVPPVESDRVALQKPEIDWCYSSCHHDNTLKSCKECHPEKK
jgi:hypothetical protein